MPLNDFAVRRIALLLSVLGVCLLLFLNEIDKPMQLSVGEISKEHLSKKIITIGTVQRRFYTKNTLLFELWGDAKISAVLFAPNNDELAAIENDVTVVVEGIVKEYRGRLEVVVEKVRRVV